jgi:hypothetical protein
MGTTLAGAVPALGAAAAGVPTAAAGTAVRGGVGMSNGVTTSTMPVRNSARKNRLSMNPA